MARRLKEARLLDLLRVLADSGEGLYRSRGVPELLGLEAGFPPPGCGLPIGNLTSQWWGNHYLDGLDHFVKRQLGIPHYLRYMDDFTLLADTPRRLVEAREAIREWLWRERRLELKEPRASPQPATGSFIYLGYRVSRAGVEVPQAVLHRMRRRLAKGVLRGDLDLARSIDSFLGVLSFGGG